MRTALALLAVALIAGTSSDRPKPMPPLMLGGYRVLAGDFHVHTGLFADCALLPWDIVLEARRQGLDVVALTDHNRVFAARIGRWVSRRIGGPTILVGEEITMPRAHVIAVGIDRTVDWHGELAATIDAVHAEGGVAIAAHPIAFYWPAFDSASLHRLDGAERMHPVAYWSPQYADQLREFFARRRLAPIGSSDYHGLTPLGMTRTFLFARGDDEASVLEAIRAKRTVVFDVQGRAVGDSALVALAQASPAIDDRRLGQSRGGFLPTLSRVCGIFGVFALTFFQLRPPRAA